MPQRIEQRSWTKYAFEFFSIFLAVISAFALTNWSENNRDKTAESKILLEIKNGLKKDIEDININIWGHKSGIASCKYFRALINGADTLSQDSVMIYYIRLTRDFTLLQNDSGYETMKARGLELISDDSLRTQLISLYEYDYDTLKKMEEEYEETQFQKTYFKDINEIMAPHFSYDERGNLKSVAVPLQLTEIERKKMMSYLMKIQVNRGFILSYYAKVIETIEDISEKLQ